jgi:hypothetical protein
MALTSINMGRFANAAVRHEELQSPSATHRIARWDCAEKRKGAIGNRSGREIRRDDERYTKDPPRANQAIALLFGYGSDSSVIPPPRT